MLPIFSKHFFVYLFVFILDNNHNTQGLLLSLYSGIISGGLRVFFWDA